jgi:hypothetical protein
VSCNPVASLSECKNFYEMGCRLNLSGSERERVKGACEHGNEPSGSIKCGEFLGQLM